AVWSLAARGLTLEQIIERLSQSPDGIARKYLDQGGVARLKQETIRCFDKWRSSRQTSAGGAPPQPPGSGLPPSSPPPSPSSSTQQPRPWPIIEVRDGELVRVINEAEIALQGLGREVYQRGPRIVRPVLNKLKAADDRATEAWRIVPVTVPYMVELMS